MLSRIRNAVNAIVGFVLDTTGQIFSYSGTLLAAATIGVVAVALLGLTPLTLTLCAVLPVVAGIYNAYFNVQDV